MISHIFHYHRLEYTFKATDIKGDTGLEIDVYRMFNKIFVVGYDDDGGVVVVLNDLMNEEQTCKRKRACLCMHRIFAEKGSHKISIVLKLADQNHHHDHHCS